MAPNRSAGRSSIPGLLALLPLLLPLACSAPPPPSRLMVLGIDGLDPDVVELMISEGQLPNFERLRRDGVFGRMHSPPPLLSPVIWTTVATGRKPVDHGIGHFTTVDPSTGEEIPVTSGLRRVPALWNLFSRLDRRVAVVGWWATWPAESVNGVMVSDHTGYHFLMAEQTEGSDERIIFPPESAPSLTEMLPAPQEIGLREIGDIAEVEAADLEHEFSFEDDLSHLRWALSTALGYRDIGLRLWREQTPDLLMVYIEGVDSMSHLFGHLYRQSDLAGEMAAQQERFGGTVEGMYQLADRIVGDYMAAMDEKTTLMVLSDHGFTLGALPEDPSKVRDLRRVSEKHHRTEASLFLYGHGVTPQGELDGADVYDVTPTLLALAGLAPSDEMPGRVLTEAVVTGEPERVASYPPEPTTDSGTATSSDTDDATLARLRSLGYIGGSAPTKNDRNLASLLLREGDYRAAARAFNDLLASQPEDPVLRTGLATALAGLGRHEAALEEYGKALEIEPLFVQAYHNRGLVLEQLGRRQEAVADYQTAVRYDSDYQPSRRALERLGEPLTRQVATSANQVQSQGLLEAARDAAQRGDYAEANKILDKAEELTPNAPVVLQYRSNIAYLQGNFETALEYLERALRQDPQNAAMQRNAQRLRRKLGLEE